MVNKKRLINTFLELVKIDSPSGEEEAMAVEMTKRLKKLGAKVERDSYGNVIAKLPGIGETFMLNAHLDTVEPGRGIKPIIKGNKIVSDGTTVLGADDKAGLSAIMEALTVVKESGAQHLPLEVVLTLGEETGLFGAKNLDYSLISAKTGISFDGHAGITNVTIAAPGLHTVNATITGRSAHAGVEPEKGISAIVIASKIISQLKLGRIDAETTANIGMIEGGSARNAVPEVVYIKGEIRSRRKEKIDKHIAHFKEIFEGVLKEYPDAKLDLVFTKEAGSFDISETDMIIERIKKVCKSINIKPRLEITGGLSDVNIFTEHGLQVVDVGAGAHDLHTKREYLDIPEFVEAAEFCYALITEVEK